MIKLRLDAYTYSIRAEFDGDTDDIVRAIANMAKYEGIEIEVEGTGSGLPIAQSLEDWGAKVKVTRDGL